MQIRFHRDVDALVMENDLHFNALDPDYFDRGQVLEVDHMEPAGDMTHVEFGNGRSMYLMNEDFEVVDATPVLVS